jgi:hypothetical protein
MRSVCRDVRWMWLLLVVVPTLSELEWWSECLSLFSALDVNCRTSRLRLRLMVKTFTNNTLILSYASQHDRDITYISIRAREGCPVKDRRADCWLWRGMFIAVSGVGGELCDQSLAIIVDYFILLSSSRLPAIASSRCSCESSSSSFDHADRRK